MRHNEWPVIIASLAVIGVFGAMYRCHYLEKDFTALEKDVSDLKFDVCILKNTKEWDSKIDLNIVCDPAVPNN